MSGSDEAAIGAVITGMYAMISGPAGPRDWSLQPAYFAPDARMMRTIWDSTGRPTLKIMTLDAYAADVTPFFAAHAFYEIETARRTDIFGAMAHAWSAYEARVHPDDETPERRGVNSIQLRRDGAGNWRIVSMIWDNARDEGAS